MRKSRVAPPEVRFWDFVEKTSECWIWTGGNTPRGYGIFCPTGSKKMYSHRFSYELHIGRIPNGMFVCHACDNPACIRPDHLFLGTARDNTMDMVTKGRHGTKGKRSALSCFLAFRVNDMLKAKFERYCEIMGIGGSEAIRCYIMNLPDDPTKQNGQQGEEGQGS
jgi:hypothetical protein